MRLIVVLHRYLGVAAGLLMGLWCLSGFVMMYQGYPHLEPGDRLKGLERLRLGPAEAQARLDLADDSTLTGFRMEMMGERPVLRLFRSLGRRQAFDLQTGAPIEGVSREDGLAVARAYARGHGIAASPAEIAVIDQDQWTVENAARRGPVRHLRLGDPAGTELYVAEQTGEAVQATTARTRFLSWFGAIPHWLYPMALRRNPAVWTQVVVWGAIVGVFLTVVGIYLGVARFRRYRSGRWSPYRGLFWWHHVIGLVFGLLTLAWVASGLFTMNPWGFLASGAGAAERARLAGDVVGADAKRALALAPQLAKGSDLAALEAAPLGGRLYLLALGRDGSLTRLDERGRPAPLTEAEVRAAVAPVASAPIADFRRIEREDAYYYTGYDQQAALPAWRVRLADAQHTTWYIDGRTGRMTLALDDVARQSRWLRTGLHDWDFTAALRRRPVWDVVVLALLAGVTAVCLTGVWMAVRRVRMDFANFGRPRT